MCVDGRQEEKGGAEKARIKKKRMLEEGASKWSKITDLSNQASTSGAGEILVSHSAPAA